MFAELLEIPQIFFNLQRKADTTPAAIGKTVFIIFQEPARQTILPLYGGILFFQGWRLGPILQFGQFLLAIEILLTSASSMIT
ncbi:MAG: hypothetical protein CBD47_02755, partial [Synechococcus sp. TMED187]